MRPEHLSADGEPGWEYRAFSNEADLLMKLADSPHTVNLLDCGFVSAQNEAPISGEIDSFGRDVIGFSRALEEYCEQRLASVSGAGKSAAQREPVLPDAPG